MSKLFILLAITIASSQALPSLSKNTIDRVIACEFGPNEFVTLRCPEGYTVYVISANYGRTDPHICRYDPRNTNCYSNQIGYAKNLCDYRTQCTLRASHSLFGDPCKKITKYLGIYLLNFIVNNLQFKLIKINMNLDVQYYCTDNAYPIG